jgi:hypothetical protein
MNDTPAGDEDVPYVDSVQLKLTPDKMAVAALLRGLSPPDPRTASFLEIGGARCINTLGVAAAHPDARCVGFDLSAGMIESGRALGAAAGLKNADLQQADILTYPRDGEKFDYIACHGVYTWVPQAVRDGIIEIIGARLAPGGIAYIGYDALPAAAGKRELSRFLISQVGHIADVAERVDAAVLIATVLRRNQRENSRLKPLLDLLVGHSPNFKRNYFYHDWLIPDYAPISLADLARAVAPHGLAYAGNAALYDLRVHEFDEAGQALIAAAGDDLVRRNTTLDLLWGVLSFRADLFVHAHAQPPAAAEPLRQLRFSAGSTSVESIEDPGLRRIAAVLAEAAPDELGFGELRARTGYSEAELDRLLAHDQVLVLFEIHASAQPFTSAPGERPRASPLVRAMLAHGEEAVSLRHEKLTISDPVMRLILVLADGSRTDADIAAGVSEVFGAPAAAGQVREAIDRLAARRLFAA